MRDFLDLNREELKRWRFEVYQTAEFLAQWVQSGTLPANLQTRTEDQLRQMMSAQGEFAGMVRSLVRDQIGLVL